MKKYITSEFCAYGHPDKLADQISDRILDSLLVQDGDTRAGIEVMVKDNVVVLGGEVNTSATPYYEQCVRDVFEDVDYGEEMLKPNNIKIINLIGQQSPEISQAVDKCCCDDIGAGDQGFMVGYASNASPEYMPLGVYVAQKIGRTVADEEFMGPDVKTQVVTEVDTVTNKERVVHLTVSAMHKGYVFVEEMRKKVREIIYENKMGLEDGIFKHQIKNNTTLELCINPAGEWKTGGPISDCGMTGRKIVADQYGGYCNVGGGAFSGKDMSKVDRSAAYMCRYLAKNIVASGLVDTAKVELGYVIGKSEPVSFDVHTTGYQGALGENVDEAFKNYLKNIDKTPKGIICRFMGHQPKYYNAARDGHFGFEGDEEWYPWECTDKALDIKNYITMKENEIEF